MRGRVAKLAGPVAGAGEDAVAGGVDDDGADRRLGPGERGTGLVQGVLHVRGEARHGPVLACRRRRGKPFRVAKPAGRRYERAMQDEAPERIAKRLARAGVASRRVAETMIAAGRVAVNGRVIDSPALNVTAADAVTVDGKVVGEPEAARLWRYYKPVGLVTSERDEKGRDTVFAHLPAEMPRVVSVGRLDLNSEGLLLLTNDGALKRRLELPSTGWLRKYRVRARGEPDDKALEPLRKGITVDGERFQPMQVGVDRQQGANVWLTVAIREGKNREVRRALQAVGLTVNRLIRVSYGPFQLGDLEPGGVEEVRPKVLREQLGLAKAADRRPGGSGRPKT